MVTIISAKIFILKTSFYCRISRIDDKPRKLVDNDTVINYLSAK